MEDTLVRVGLWVHIASAMAVLAGIGAELLSGHLVTRSRDTSQVRILAQGAELGGRVASLGLLGLLVSGPDLASRTGFFEGEGVLGWIAVAIVAILVLGGLGGAIHRRAFKQARELAGPEGAAPIPDELRAHLARPTAWVSMHAAVGLVLGTVWIMSNKPDGVVGATIPVVLGGLLGAAAGLVVARMTAARLA